METFGFHLPTLDLRQDADVHERVVADLLRVTGVEVDYLASDEAALRLSGLKWLIADFCPAHLRTVPIKPWSESEIVRAGFGWPHRCINHNRSVSYSISKCDSISDLLEVNILLEGGRALARGKSSNRSGHGGFRCSMTIVDLQRAFAGMTEWLGLEDVTALTRAHGLT